MPSFQTDVTVRIGQERHSSLVSTYTVTQFFQVWATMVTGTIVADDDKAFCMRRTQRHCFMLLFENILSFSLSLYLHHYFQLIFVSHYSIMSLP